MDNGSYDFLPGMWLLIISLNFWEEVPVQVPVPCGTATALPGFVWPIWVEI